MAVKICSNIAKGVSIVAGLIQLWVAIWGESDIGYFAIFLILGLITVGGNIYALARKRNDLFSKITMWVSLIVGILIGNGGISQMPVRFAFGIALLVIGVITVIGNLVIIISKRGNKIESDKLV